MIKAVVLGLCNPGKEFDMTWHNIGAACIGNFLSTHNVKMQETGHYAFAVHNDILFAFSRSAYMNDSSKIILALKQKYFFEPKNLIVAHDEVMLSHGQIKCTFGGSAKGHNGLRSIISLIGSDFYRIKIGVGHPGKGTDLAKYLLSKVQPNLWNLCLKNFEQAITWERFGNLADTNLTK